MDVLAFFACADDSRLAKNANVFGDVVLRGFHAIGEFRDGERFTKQLTDDLPAVGSASAFRMGVQFTFFGMAKRYTLFKGWEASCPGDHLALGLFGPPKSQQTPELSSGSCRQNGDACS